MLMFSKLRKRKRPDLVEQLRRAWRGYIVQIEEIEREAGELLLPVIDLDPFELTVDVDDFDVQVS